MNLDPSLCTDRYSRYAAYGYGENESGQSRIVRGGRLPTKANWDEIDWAELQETCLTRNAERYEDRGHDHKKFWSLHLNNNHTVSSHPQRDRSCPRYKPRSAVVLRSWLGKKYSEHDLHNIRALVMELSLFSGAEYEVIIMIDAQDHALPDPSDERSVDELKQSNLPPELRNLAVFFNRDILRDWYPKINHHR
jgi:Protein of unknown function (DUF3405)